jgi:hypothetical protein
VGGSGRNRKTTNESFKARHNKVGMEIKNRRSRRPSKFALIGPNLSHAGGKGWWRLKFKLADGSSHSLDEQFTNKEGLRLYVFTFGGMTGNVPVGAKPTLAA